MTEARISIALDETRFPDMELTLRIMRLATLWRTRLDRALRPHGMTMALMRPLAYLTMLPDGSTQSDLACAMNVDSSALVRVLDMLEKQGLVCRQPDRQDRRAKRLVLTPAGQAQCGLFHQIATKLEHENRAALPPESLAALITGLTTLLASPDIPPETLAGASPACPEQEAHHAS
jgi:MarR family transcriptional regulator for hemolysin